MRKYGRNYALYIQENETTLASESNTFNTSVLNEFVSGFLLIEPPFTIEFDVQRDLYSASNFASIRIYNLSKKNRNLIFKPQYDWGSLKQIQLQAGYGDNLAMIFNGDIQEAWSIREGVNFITQAQCFGNGFAYVNAQTNQSIVAATPNQSVLESIMADLPGVKVGKIGNYPGTLANARSFSGSTIKLLRELSGGGFFIDNGVANCLNFNETLTGPIDTIDSDSGLLGTPLIEGGVYVVVNMLFEPQVVMGQSIKLNSTTFNYLPGTNSNTVYKVVGIQHKGTISPTVCGEAITTLKLAGGRNFAVVT